MRRAVACLAAIAVALASCGAGVSGPSGGSGKPDAASDAWAGPPDASDAYACSEPESALGTDPKNCGACGHDCLGGGCEGGACLPVVLAHNAQNVIGVAVDENDVYFAQQLPGLVSKVSKDGGPVQILSAGHGDPWLVAVAGSNVYWMTRGALEIQYTKRDGGWPDGVDAGLDSGSDASSEAGSDAGTMGNVGVLTVVAPPADVYGIATDGKDVYWTDLSAGNVWHTPIAGSHPSAPEILAYVPPGTTGIGMGREGLAFLGYTGHVYYFPTGTTASEPTQLTRIGNIDSRFVATDDTNVYWTMSDNGSVWTVPVAGGDTTLISGEEATPWGIAVDSSGVYWANSAPCSSMPGSGECIRRARFENGAWSVVTLATGLGAPMGIALDSVAVYWGEDTSGRIMKIAK